MRISTLRERVRSELLDFAWGQWSQLGLGGAVTRIDRWAVDPEALLLLTLEVGRRDPRLFDELLDWLALNGDLLILQRLRNLARRYPGDRSVLEASLAWASSQNPALRWNATPARTGGPTSEATLFDPELVGYVREPDPVFGRFGYLRPRAERSLKSVRPDPREPIAFAFKLRLLFGLGSRSEVLRILLTLEEARLDAARIAEEAGFAKRNINETLSALADSGAVQARWSRNQRVFSVFRGKWANLLEIGPGAEHLPATLAWVPLLRVLTSLYVWFEHHADPGWSEYLAASEARSLVDGLTRDLGEAGISSPESRNFHGSAYWEAFEQLVDDSLGLIGR